MRNTFEPSPALIAAAREILVSQENTKLRLRALWSLHALGGADRGTLVFLLKDPDENLRVHAIRLLTDFWPIDTVLGPSANLQPPHDAELLAIFQKMAETDGSGLVRLALASTLQRMPLADRVPLATALAGREEDAEDHNLPCMVWYGISPLSETSAEALLQVAKATKWPNLIRYISRSLAEKIEKNPEPVAAIIEFAISQPSLAGDVFDGFSDGFEGWRKAPAPRNWAAAKVAFEKDGELVDQARELSVLFGDREAMESLKKIAFDDTAALADREAALRSLIDSQPEDLRAICEKLLGTRNLNRSAVRGLGIYDDPEIGLKLVKDYGLFSLNERPAVIEVLVSRPAWAGLLLDKISAGGIPKADLTPFHARQIYSFANESLTAQLTAVWGKVEKSDEAKELRVSELRGSLTGDVLAKADLSKGRALFASLCSGCHTMYESGGKLGPNLTGSGRADLGYLLENIIAPSAVVPNEYRMTIYTLADGRVVSGVAAAATERTITVRSIADETTIERSAIVNEVSFPNSIMPEGLIDSLAAEQTRDLIAYLMHPTQVPLPEPAEK